MVSLGLDADGKRIRRKVSGQTRAEVKDKLKELHSDLDAGVRTAAGYTAEMAVTDWLAEGPPGRAAKTVEVDRDALGPVLTVIGRTLLRDLTVHDVRTALATMAVTHSRAASGHIAGLGTARSAGPPRRPSTSRRPLLPRAGGGGTDVMRPPQGLTRSASAGPGYATPAAVFGASAPAGVSARGMKMAATRPIRPMHARARMAYP